MTDVERPSLQSEGAESPLRLALSDRKVQFGLLVLVPIVLVAVLAPLIAPYDPFELGVGPSLEGPSAQNWLGTDFFGRDVLSRMLYGARTSTIVAVLVGLGVLIIGVPPGVAAGYFGGRLDTYVMRIADVVLSIPWLLLALALATILGFGLNTVLIALVIVYSPQMMRLTRNSVMTVRSNEYVSAGVGLGESQWSLVSKYVLPNAYFPILVLLTSLIGWSILGEAAISYLGVGVQPPNTSWGLELAENQQYFAIAAHLAIVPGAAISMMVLSLNFLGDGISDVLGAIGQRKTG